MFIKPIIMTIMLATAAAESSCSTPNANEVQRRQQEMLSQESNMQVGMPAIVNFQEKRMAKMILELRDNPKLSTITYVRDMQGKLHKVCDSIGFGLPYATQYTSPTSLQRAYSTNYEILPQADPNGLFSPSSADATWVLCTNPAEKSVSPTYIEDRITVSQYPLPLE